jgi:regulatory protein
LTEGRPDAFEVALAALRRKERTSAELDGWLRQRGYAGEEVDAAVSRLTEAGELDDRRFALRYAQDKRELRGWGAERIREALAARAGPSALIEVALEAESRDAAVDRATELLVRRGRPLGDDAERSRALGFLTRRGYEYEVAYEAVRMAARDPAPHR